MVLHMREVQGRRGHAGNYGTHTWNPQKHLVFLINKKRKPIRKEMLKNMTMKVCKCLRTTKTLYIFIVLMLSYYNY